MSEEKDNRPRDNRKERVAEADSEKPVGTAKSHFKGMGRRRFLNILAGLGLSGASIEHLSQDTVAKAMSNPGKSVPFVSKVKLENPESYESGLPDEPLPTTETVETTPLDEWVTTKIAHKAATALSKKFDTESSCDGNVRVFVRTNRRGNKELVVRPTTVYRRDSAKESATTGESDSQENLVVASPSIGMEQLKAKVPDTVSQTATLGDREYTVDDINVEIESAERKLIDKEYDEKYRPVPGGAQIHVYNTNDPDYTFGSTCAPYYSYDASERVMVVSGHQFSKSGKTYEHVHQPGKDYVGDNRVGERYDYIFTSDGDTSDGCGTYRYDAGVWAPESETDLTSKLAAKDGSYRKTISGYVTWDKIQQEEGSSWTIKKQGTTTAVTSGTITDICSNDRRFQTSANAEGGDSGGAFYHVDSTGDALIAGVVNAATIDGASSEGNDIEWVLNEFNLTL